MADRVIPKELYETVRAILMKLAYGEEYAHLTLREAEADAIDAFEALPEVEPAHHRPMSMAEADAFDEIIELSCPDCLTLIRNGWAGATDGELWEWNSCTGVATADSLVGLLAHIRTLQAQTMPRPAKRRCLVVDHQLPERAAAAEYGYLVHETGTVWGPRPERTARQIAAMSPSKFTLMRRTDRGQWVPAGEKGGEVSQNTLAWSTPRTLTASAAETEEENSDS